MLKILTLTLAVALLAGCAALRVVEPDSAGVVLAHVSHISQHNPIARWLGRRPTNYGYQTASLRVSWYSRHRRWRFSMSDGYLLPDGWLPGPHEVFQAQLGYTFWRRNWR
jgi:outer membrane biogenesis lipoprotein LolB